MRKKVIYSSVVLFIGILLLATFCDPVKNEVYYSFDDIVIKRTDQRTKTTLFYLQDGVPIDTIWVHYSGRDAWFDADLYFLADKTVLVDGGCFERNRDVPHYFISSFLDFERPGEYYEVEFINGTQHNTPTGALFRLRDSLTQEGRKYQIILSDPDNERDLFNKDNPLTKVKMTPKMP